MEHENEQQANEGPIIYWGFVETGAANRFNWLSGFVLIGLLAVVGWVVTPILFWAPFRGVQPHCKGSLKQLGTAMEMYSVDWDGHYPPGGKAQLTPNYLKTIPECPAAGTDTYVFEQGPTATYNTGSYEEYYFIYCSGENHRPVGAPKNYPQYTGIVGLIER